MIEKMTTKMENNTIIEINTKYLNMITYYLDQNKYSYRITHPSSPEKARIEIHELNPEDAFYLGVNTQVQLLEGEILI
jgi:hypothetical protein